MNKKEATVVSDGEYYVHVVVDGKTVRSFHVISDDYAFTNAKEYAAKLNEKFSKGNVK